jgi:hypothetical protein
MAQKVDAVCYLECSALKGNGIREVFRTATTCGIGALLSQKEAKDREKGCIVA